MSSVYLYKNVQSPPKIATTKNKRQYRFISDWLCLASFIRERILLKAILKKGKIPPFNNAKVVPRNKYLLCELPNLNSFPNTALSFSFGTDSYFRGF